MLSSARNFDGMVSRFLASRLCSKVPVKAKAHVRSRSGREWSVDPGWRSGRSPATRERLRTGKVPHFVPLCNTEPASRPTASSLARSRPKSALFAGISCGADSCRSGRVLHVSCSARSARGFALRRAVAGRSVGAKWEELRGQRARERRARSAAATSSSTAGTSSSATTSWIFGAALAACSERRAARRERASARLGGERRWRAGRRGARPGAARRRAAGCRSRGSARSRCVERRARPARPGRARAAARLSSAASRPGWRRPTSASARRGASPARDRDPQQVQHVGQLGLDRACARARAPAQPVLGREDSRRPARRAASAMPEPPGRER